MTNKITYKGDIIGEFSSDITAEIARKELSEVSTMKTERFYIFKENEPWVHGILHTYEDLLYDLGYSISEAEKIATQEKPKRLNKETYIKIKAFIEVFHCAQKIVSFLETNPVCEVTF